MKMYNVTKEKYEIQCVGKVYTFLPNKITEVDDANYKFVEETVKELGVFTIYPSMTEKHIKDKSLEALHNYMNGSLRTRITNYYRYQDEMKKKGVTLQQDANLERALRWDKEIRGILKIEKKIEEELSFGDFNKDIGELSKDLFKGNPIVIKHGLEDKEIENIVNKTTSKKVVNDVVKDILNGNVE